MLKKRIIALLILILGVVVGLFVYKSEIAHMKVASGAQVGKESMLLANYPFKLGLDLSGGTHLIYQADVSKVPASDVNDAMSSLRDVIERRVDSFGISEPVVEVQNGDFSNQGQERLTVDLPGVTDISKAVAMIGQTPLLEFRTEAPAGATTPQTITVGKNGVANLAAPLQVGPQYVPTQLTGQYLQSASLIFDQNTGEPQVSLQFNSEGTKLFSQITSANIGKTVAIYLDGQAISTPVVQEAITNGQAIISGNFTADAAKALVGELNSGALPVPITLISTQTIGPSLGAKAVNAGVMAGLIGFLVIALFLILWYRLPGVIAVLALSIYMSLMLALFKLIPVTLTAAGIAGFIISIGIAVDANVLIFERIKEELRNGEKSITESIKTGFSRAWLSIRDSNISSIITAIILFWFGTPLIQGFALTFLIGVIVSMICAVSITRLFLYALNITKVNKTTRFLFGSGFSSANKIH